MNMQLKGHMESEKFIQIYYQQERSPNQSIHEY